MKVSFLRKDRRVIGGALATAIVIGLVLPSHGKSFIVFDPEVLAENIKIWEADWSLYQFIKQMSQRLSHANRLPWKTMAIKAAEDYTQSKYGETIQWQTLMSGHPAAAADAWANATLARRDMSFMSTEQVGQSDLLARLGSTEIIDGSSIKCLSTVAEYRQQSVQNAPAIQSLQQSQMDDSDKANSNVAQANMLNMSASQAANEARAQGALHACQVEQQVISNKLARDQAVADLNFTSGYVKAMNQPETAWAGQGNTQNTWLIP